MNSTWQIREAFFSGGPKQYKITIRDVELLIDADENGLFNAANLPRGLPLGIFAKPVYERK